MQEIQLISAKEFCLHHQIQISFLQSLQELGLLEITTTNDEPFLQSEQVNEVEKLVRMHYDLHINLEGLDAISNLLQRMENLQKELLAMHNRLRLYENE